MKEIRFPSTLTMDHPHLLSQALGACMEVPYGERLTVDLTDLQRISAFGVAALGARLTWLVRAKRMPSGSVVRRPESGRISNDLMRMGLYHLLQEGSVGIYQQEAERRPQELWLVDRAEDLGNSSERLTNLLRSVLPATESDFKKVQVMLEGLGDNVFRHAKSHTGAMLCGQAFLKSGWIEFACADTGQGLFASLRRFSHMARALKGDADAILTALTLKIAEESGALRAGFLNTLSATARKAEGELTCMSGEAALILKKGQLHTTSVPSYPGTVLGVRLKLLAEG